MQRDLIILSVCFLFFAHCSGKRPDNLGIKNGKLKNCPKSPNCVSSMTGDNDKDHFIKPIEYTGTLEEARLKLLEVIKSMKRTEVIVERNNYIHAEFTSAVFRFVDDVEFYFPIDKRIIHLRSASRLGRSDFGVNRKRIEKIREAFINK